MSATEILWLGIGGTAQALFAGRMIVQWWVSETRGESVVPPAFWYMSLAGGLMMLAYAIWRLDPIFIVGQATGLFVYARNVALLRAPRQQPAGELAVAPECPTRDANAVRAAA